MSEPTEPTRVAGAMTVFRKAYGLAARAVEQLPARPSYDAATALGEAAREIADAAAGLRARMAARLAQERGLTVRALARELNMSPSNAGDMLARAAREITERPDPGRGAGRSSG